MKYSININQAGIVEHGLHTKTDLVDWAIIDYLMQWYFTERKKTVYDAEKETQFVWINYNHLIQEMPLIKIRTKSHISERIKKLRDLGLIETYLTKDKSLYFNLTPYCLQVIGFKEISETGVPRRITGCSPKDNRVFPESEQGVPRRITGCSPKDNSTNSIPLNSIPISKPNNNIEDQFNLLWSLYPKKINKQKAYKAFIKLKPNPELFKTIIKAIKKAKNSRQWQKDNGAYIPHLSTYLNNHRWEDEIPEEEFEERDEEISRDCSGRILEYVW
jgi:hypothetical protein